MLERHHDKNQSFYFIPAAPTNHLKMDPWWNEDATVLVDHIRGGMAQATLFRIKDGNFKTLRAALRRPLGGSN